MNVRQGVDVIRQPDKGQKKSAPTVMPERLYNMCKLSVESAGEVVVSELEVVASAVAES